jgi:DNA-binding NarL/FixJ family response regulator
MNHPIPIRVLLVDDHLLVRAGIRGWLMREVGIQVVAEAGNGAKSIELYAQHLPDVVLMDCQLPDIDGIEATRRIRARHPEARVVMLSIDVTAETIHAAKQAGAVGYLPKSVTSGDLLRAVRAVAAGNPHFEDEIAERLRERSARTGLSPRELEVLRMVACGRINKEIASSLGIGEVTIKTHLSHIFTKLGALDRTHAVAIAHERGLLR